ncbi:MAG: conjugal transfer protein TrbI [Lachnospiraceae bacterium]|nr:conjugal transfer protein TrbI [Lachnospiraceae bacterium]
MNILGKLFPRKDNDDLNDIGTTPDGKSGQGVKTMNKKPILIVLLIALSFVAILSYVAYDRQMANFARDAKEKNQGGDDASKRAGAITAGYDDRFNAVEMMNKYDDQPKEETPKKEESKIEPPVVQQNQPVPQMTPPPMPAKRPPSEEEKRVWAMRFQAYQQSLAARTDVETARNFASRTRSSTNQARQNLPQSSANEETTAYQARLERLRAQQAQRDAMQRQPVTSGGGLGGSTSGTRSPTASQLDQELSLIKDTGNSYDQFNRLGKWDLASDVESPRSAYTLRTGSVIPAMMISGINSELPGQVTAQVSQPVYDSPTGKYLLIPQGSRLIGTYSNQIAYGQSRVLMAWQRIIFPDGRALDIGSMPGADQAGYSGFNDKVDNHYFRIFGSALLLSGIVAGISISQDTDDDNDSSDSGSNKARNAMSSSLGQVLGQAMAQMLQKNLNISPTLQIRPGYRFNVMVVKDISFRSPYRAFGY